MDTHNLSWQDVEKLAKNLDVRSVVTASAETYHDSGRGKLKVTYIPDIDLKD